MLTSVVRFLSAEWALKGRPNSGGVVVFRTTWISVLVFGVAIGLVERLAPGSSWHFDATNLALAVRDHFAWFGAIFAAVYAGLYSRFASQWQYLANLYNQIMSTQAQAPADDNVERKRVYANWMAGFVEDAEDLHLALKPAYAAVIRSMLQADGSVEAAFVASTKDGAKRLADLKASIAKVLPDESPPPAPLLDP